MSNPDAKPEVLPDNMRGLYQKYLIAHADGTPFDSTQKYFVLRYSGHDEHARACRAALVAYSFEISAYNPLLARDLLAAIDQEGGVVNSGT